ncbi:secretin N-terminal domain-containing protein [Planctomycetota bacterium]
MNKARPLFVCVLLALAVIIIFLVGFYEPTVAYLSSALGQSVTDDAPADKEAADSNELVSEAVEPNQADTPDPNKAETSEPNQPPKNVKSEDSKGRPMPPGRKSGSDPNDKKSDSKEKKEPEDPNQVSLNLKDVGMKDIVKKLGDWTGKVIIPEGDVMKQKLTIYGPEKIHRDKALGHIYSALRGKGYVAEETSDNEITLKPIGDAKGGRVPIIPQEVPLASLANREQFVQRFWTLESYSPSQMHALIENLISEHGYVSADETTGTVTAIDSVSTLMRIEKIIHEFDVPQAQQTVTDLIPVENDPIEIVQLLRVIMGDEASGNSRSRMSSSNFRNMQRRTSSSKKGSSTSSVFVGASQQPITLVPEPKRKWIIARASAQDMDTIREWIGRLDRKETVESEYETVQLKFADAREVASRIEDALDDLPGAELRPNAVIRPLEQSRQIMIFARADVRDMIKKLVMDIDKEPGTFEEQTFDLKHADADQIVENIENLYQDQRNTGSRYSYNIYFGGRSQGPDTNIVRAIAFPTMMQVTVHASPENMRKIEKQIKEWDQPLDVNQVKPRIIELKNSDPVQMTQLLSKLFTEDDGGSTSFWDMYFGTSDDKEKIVGPLYGQLTFEELPGTKKIIVISKIPEAYDVIEELIRELDKQEMAEMPAVVTLEYADPELLSERLNALFNEPGTTATIRMWERGLSDYSVQDNTSNSGNNNNNNNNNRNNSSQNNNSNEYRPWWTTGSRRTDEEPLSNVIGRVRFIPDRHSKSILVLAPPEYLEDIRNTIKELDVPGRQVMLKAVIMMVDHSSMTSLGIQLSSNPLAFGDIGENALTTFNQLSALSTSGNIIPDSTPLGFSGTGTVAGVDVQVSALIDFLEKNLDAKILNQQTLWTKDNEESSFFKGDIVSIQTESSVGGTGIATQTLEPTPVGMTLRVRPSITPERQVDMIINVELSQLKDELVNLQPVRSMMDSTTQMIIEDGRTLMLGGILFQRDYVAGRKVPGLGDIPLLGALFRHKEIVKANSEMIIFITPYVVDDAEPLPYATQNQIDAPLRRLAEVKAELKEALAELTESE